MNATPTLCQLSCSPSLLFTKASLSTPPPSLTVTVFCVRFVSVSPFLHFLREKIKNLLPLTYGQQQRGSPALTWWLHVLCLVLSKTQETHRKWILTSYRPVCFTCHSLWKLVFCYYNICKANPSFLKWRRRCWHGIVITQTERECVERAQTTGQKGATGQSWLSSILSVVELTGQWWLCLAGSDAACVWVVGTSQRRGGAVGTFQYCHEIPDQSIAHREGCVVAHSSSSPCCRERQDSRGVL